MTPDEQEAGSVQHASGVQVVPLSSGSWAVLPNRACASGVEIFETLSEAEPAIRAIAAQQQVSWQRRQLPMPGPRQQQVLETSLEELGL